MSKTPTEADRAIGARIRAKRLLAGVSQQKLADATGVTFQQVQKYEKGANRVAAGRLEGIAAALGCTAADLISEGGQNPGVPRDPAEMQMLGSREGIRLARAFASLPAGPTRTAFVEMAEKMAAAIAGQGRVVIGLAGDLPASIAAE